MTFGAQLPHDDQPAAVPAPDLSPVAFNSFHSRRHGLPDGQWREPFGSIANSFDLLADSLMAWADETRRLAFSSNPIPEPAPPHGAGHPPAGDPR
jgi:hypothetical protein